MTQVTANGNTYSDDGSTSKDMGSGGYRTNLLPMLGDVMHDAQAAIDGASTAAAAAVAAAVSEGAAAASASAAAASAAAASGAAASQVLKISREAVTANREVTVADIGKLFDCVGNISLSIQSCGSLGDRWTLIVRNSGVGSVTLYASGTDTIDGSASMTVKKRDVVLLQCNGVTLYSVLLVDGSAPKALPILSTVGKAPVSALEQITTSTDLPGATAYQTLLLHAAGLYVTAPIYSSPPSTEFFTSTDLVTYTKRSAPLAINAKSLVWTGSFFIAFLGGSSSDLSGSAYYRSSNLVSWESAKSLPVSLRVMDVVSDGNGTVLLIPYYTTENSTYYKSTDHGVTWVAKIAPVSLKYLACFAAYVSGLFLLWGSAAYYTCPVGSDTWTTRTLPAANMLSGSITTRSDGKLSLDYQSTYAETQDGIAWTVITKPSTQGLYLKIPSGVIICATNVSPYPLATSHDNGSTFQQRGSSTVYVSGKNYIDFSNLKGLGQGKTLYNLNTAAVGLFSEV